MKIQYRAIIIKEDWPYIHSRALPKLVEDTCGIMAIDTESNTKVGAVVFDHLWPTSAQIHIVVDKPMVLRHGFLEMAADFIFNHQGKKVVFGLTPAGNKKALAFNKRAGGFTEVYRVPDGFDVGYDLVMMQLRKEDCTYLPKI